MTEYKLFAQRIGLVGVVNIVSSLRGLILLPILTKTLGTELYGVWAQILVTVSLLTPFAVLQLDTVIIRFLAGEKNVDKIRERFYSIFTAVSLFGLLLATLIFIFSKPLAFAFFDGENSVVFVRLLSFIVFFSALDTISIEYFRAFRQMKKYSGFLILREVLEVSLISYTVLFGYSLLGALLSLIIIRAFLLILGSSLIRSQIGIGYPNLSVLKPYLNFSLPLLPVALSSWIVNLSDRYVIAYLIGMSSVGIYSAAYSIGCIVGMFMYPISSNLFPTISNSYENNKIEEVKVYLKYSLKLYLMLAIPSLLGLAVLSKSLLVTLATSEFLTAYLVVPIVAFGTILLSCGSFIGIILMLFKRTRTIGLIYGIAALVNLILNIILVPIIGILGAAISTFITFFIYAVVIGFLSYRELSFEIDFKFISKSIIASIPMALVVWKLNPYGAVSISIAVGIAIGVYFGVLILLRGFTKKEYEFLKDMLKV